MSRDSWDLSYTYDAAGQRTGISGSLAQVNPGTAVSNTQFNANNQLTNWNGQSLTYDANGNLTSDGTNTYTWDERNQLRSIGGAVTASFQYDAMGRRNSKTIGSNSTGYLYDGANFVQEQSGGAVTANLVTGPRLDEPYMRESSAGTHSLLPDALGSILMATDVTQATVTSYSYDAYGATMQTGTNDNSQQYAGRENDGTGLYYNRARYYSPQMGRFISQDPIGWASGQTNGYAYVGGNPISHVDPAGLMGSRGNPNQEPAGTSQQNSCQCDCSRDWSNYWNDYMNFVSQYAINLGPYAAAMAGGVMPKSWAPVYGFRGPMLGSRR